MLHPLYRDMGRYPDVQSILLCLLQRGINICQSEFGNVQLMNWSAGYLEIKAQHGFQDEFLKFFERVSLSDTSACARALCNREPIMIEDVTLDPKFGPCREILCRAGIRAVQSTPLVSTSGALVGILSTHFATNHKPTNSQMRAVRGEALSAANAIISLRANAEGDVSDRIQRSLKLSRESREAIARAEKLFRR